MTQVKALYIHIPFCISKCKYCDFFSVPCSKKEYDVKKENYIPSSYLTALKNEILYRIKKYNIKILETIYIGGGTPSLLTEEQVDYIFSVIKENVTLSKDCEITIEANPDDITKELLDIWKKNGINRISLGIQSFCDKALSYVSRRARCDVNKKALEIIKSNWDKDLSVDLICGLPLQSEESFFDDLRYLVSVSPDHISMYSLTIEDETPLGKEFNTGVLNYDFDFADDLWLKSKQILKENGYIHYEVSNFCREGKKCLHNLKYWNHESYVGCGSGGTGTVYNDDGSGFRWTNIANINKYCDFWNENNIEKIESVEIIEEITKDVSIFEFFMMGMRKLSGINENYFESVFKQSIPKNMKDTLIKWKNKNLCQISKDENGTNYTLGNDGIMYLSMFLRELLG